jgi:hypothetical protein
MINGVHYAIATPDATAEMLHDAWLQNKQADGWKYGPVKDAEKKEHPCCVPYEELSDEHRLKDYFFHAVVRSMQHLLS